LFAGTLRHSGEIRATGLSVDASGSVVLSAYGDAVVEAGALVDVSGVTGGQVSIESRIGDTEVAGLVTAWGSEGHGGRIQILGEQVALADTVRVDASGATGGGEVLVGGDYQGANSEVRNAATTDVADGASLRADATGHGDGGKVVVWADDTTIFHGVISARGGEQGGDGGLAEISGKQHLVNTGTADLRAQDGEWGTLLLDPGRVVVSTASDAQPDTFNNVDLGNQLDLANVQIQTSLATGANGLTEDIDIDAAVNWSADTILGLNAGNEVHINANLSNTNSVGLVDARSNGSGVVTIADGVTFNVDLQAGTVNHAAGTAIFNGDTLFDNLNLSGGELSGAGDMTVASDFKWDAGTVSIETGIAGGATLDFQSAGGKTLNTILTNSGTVNVQSGATGDINGTGTINNLKNRVIDFQDDNNFASTLTFNNAGFLKKTGGALTTLPGLDNQADGKVDVNAGTLALGGTGNHDGQFVVAAGSKLAIGAGGQTNSFQTGSSITGDGTTEFADGNNTLDSGSTYTLAGDTEISGGATTFNTGSSQNNLTISGGAVSYEENTTTGGYTQSGGVLDGSATVTVNG
ncbi:MAG: hypothetical protein GY731_16575, partial [Gammaproteobacteria bacterium]|nr:hypothetical protein [Gammaproteobacteria bacterium]